MNRLTTLSSARMVVTPKLAVMPIIARSPLTGVAAIAARIRSATSAASGSPVRGSRMANSTPTMRPSWSLSRRCFLQTSTTARSTVSPAGWP